MKRISKTRGKPLTKIGRLPIGLLVVWLLLLVAGSCTQADVEEDVIPPHALKDVEAGFNLNVLANRTPVTRSITFTPNGTIESDTLAIGVKDLVQTKATTSLSETEESQISSLWVGQYDVATGTRLFNQYISSMTDNTVNLKLKQSQNGSKSRVYFVSNAGDLGAIADTTILKKHTLSYESAEAGLPANSLCKMMGMWEGVVSVGGVKDIIVELTRLLAKITFTYSMGANFTFTPTVVQLKNAPTVSQVEAPTEQLTTGDIGYIDYTGTANSNGATVYWYLPENMAGTATGANAVDSEKKKIGKGVTNATCIELTGNAVQGGVTYENVTFRFYPGSNENNYDILRNAHYTMAVTLVGIDVSDDRITVGEIPDIEVDPTEMPAKKGGEKEVQITARPGQPWVFKMPDWLSAKLGETDITSGADITHQGPANVVFKAVSANPKAEDRSVTFPINVGGKDQEIKIVQAGATLEKGSDISLTATKDSEGSSSFTATEGLGWSAALSDGDGWLGWSDTNSATSGDEAPAGAQALKVKATTSNPSAQVRSGKITVKAGASVGDAAYTGLKQEIVVEQAGSAVTSSQITIAAEGVSSQKSSFTATAGLDWAASVTADWITLTGATSGNPTTGSPQEITFDVPVNPNSSERKGDITVRAGDASVGPTGTIGVTQPGSTFSSTNPTSEIAAAGGTTTGTITATAGLEWAVSPATSNGITVSPTGGTGEATLTFTGAANNGAERTGTFTISVTGASPARTATVTVTQTTGETGAYIGNLQVCKTDEVVSNWSTAITNCINSTKEGKIDWRLPTRDELVHMVTDKSSLHAVSGFVAYVSGGYWSATNHINGGAWYVDFLTSGGGNYAKANPLNVRCVRDKKCAQLTWR